MCTICSISKREIFIFYLKNVELQVQLDEQREEVKDKEALLVRAKYQISYSLFDVHIILYF